MTLSWGQKSTATAADCTSGVEELALYLQKCSERDYDQGWAKWGTDRYSGAYFLCRSQTFKSVSDWLYLLLNDELHEPDNLPPEYNVLLRIS